MKKDDWENAYFMARPRRLSSGKFLVRFYSRHEWPWYQARFISGSKKEWRAHFEQFKLRAEAHRKGL